MQLQHPDFLLFMNLINITKQLPQITFQQMQEFQAI